MRILCFSLLGIISLALSGCHLVRFARWGLADFDDYKKFPSVELAPSSTPFHFAEANESSKSFQLPKTLIVDDAEVGFAEGLRISNTYAFLVIRNDTVVHEYYQDPLDQETAGASFSVAKSLVATLIGIAVKDGIIESVQDPITKYLDLPEDKRLDKITIEHVLTMRSGIDFNEGYTNPFSGVARLYYGKNLDYSLKKIKIRNSPGMGFDYHSFNTQLLAFILESASGMSIDKYAEAKLWQPLGMEHAASWSLDSKKNGNVKAFCCLNATARDYAKLGRLYLKDGKWEGKQIISPEWVAETKNFKKGGWYVYSYQWWQGEKIENNSMSAVGVLDQYVYVNFDHDLVIVRLGNRGDVYWPYVFAEVVALNPPTKTVPKLADVPGSY